MQQRPRTSPLEWALVGVAAAAALIGWICMETQPDIGVGIVVWTCAFIGLSAFSSLVRCFLRPNGVGGTLGRMRRSKQSDPFGAQLSATAVAGRAAWLLPFALAPLLLVTLPIAFAATDADWTILGLVALLVLVVAPAGMLMGWLVWMLVILPLVLLGRAAVHPRADGTGFAVGLALLLLSIVTFAVTLVASAPGSASDTRSRRGAQLAALLGANDRGVEHPALLWIARATVLVGIGAIALLIVVGRRAARRSQRTE